MKRVMKKNWGFVLFLILSSCGTFLGNGDGSSGPANLKGDSDLQVFDASAGQDTITSFFMKNSTKGPIRLTATVFENNLCGAFSFYNLTDLQNRVLLDASDVFSYQIPVDGTVNVNVRFSPQACSFQNYTSGLHVYFKESSGKLNRTTFTLRSEGVAPNRGGEVTQCPEEDLNFQYEEEFFSSIPPSGEYFLRVDRMRAFIFPTQKTDQSAIIGTDIGVDASAFTPPYIKFNVDQDTGEVTIDAITACQKFDIPSSESDSNFEGATTRLTAPGPVTATIKRNLQDRITNLNVANLRVKLRAEGIGTHSIIRDPFGRFQISLEAPLTTEQTAPDPMLGTFLRNTKGFRDDIFNLVDTGSGTFAMKGSPLIAGKLVLVGKGKFDDKDGDFIGEEQTAKNFLVKQEAFLFIQLEATVTSRVPVEE